MDSSEGGNNEGTHGDIGKETALAGREWSLKFGGRRTSLHISSGKSRFDFLITDKKCSPRLILGYARLMGTAMSYMGTLNRVLSTRLYFLFRRLITASNKIELSFLAHTRVVSANVSHVIVGRSS